MHNRQTKPVKALPGELKGAPSTIAIVPGAFDAANGVKTPFGHRWGGDVFRLSAEHLAALRAGQTLAVDVQGEYVAFLKCAGTAKQEHLSTGALPRPPTCPPELQERRRKPLGEGGTKKANLRARRSAPREGRKGRGYGG